MKVIKVIREYLFQYLPYKWKHRKTSFVCWKCGVVVDKDIKKYHKKVMHNLGKKKVDDKVSNG